MKKGFTLVELLAVIVVLGLLMTIAIPAVLTVSNNVKKKSYETKIEMIENTAVSYGENNLKEHFKKAIKEGDPSKYGLVKIYLEATGPVVTETDPADKTIYYAHKFTVNDLAERGELTYDSTDRCTGTLPAGLTANNCKKNYNNVIFNPVNDNIVNNCNVYVYYKNNRIYATFDKTTCNDVKTTPEDGHEYSDKL